MFLHVSVILFTGGGWYPSMHCRWYPGSLAAGLSGGGGEGGGGEGGGFPACLAGVQAHTWGGGSPGPHPGGGFSRPTPKGRVVYPSMHWGRHPPPMATAAGGTHPAGMHSCSQCERILTWAATSWRATGRVWRWTSGGAEGRKCCVYPRLRNVSRALQ